ncbi:MAG: iron ABC transporter permease [Pelolinea sp.]|nr:iron ABC transporter permease [Pelolinea sp.]
MKKTVFRDQHFLFWIIPILFLLGFYFFPMASIFWRTFGTGTNALTTNQVNWTITGKAIGFTFYQALLSTFYTLLIGIPASLLFGRFSFRGKNILRILSTLPFIFPTVVVAAGFNALIGPNGWLNLLLMDMFQLSTPPIHLLNSITAILIAHVFYNTSIVIRVVGTAWEQLDRKIENAARMLGASPWNVFRKITFPLLFPSISSAAILVFLFDFTSFGVILMMGGAKYTTIEVEIYIQTMQFLNLKMAGILSFIQLFFTMLLTFISLQISQGKQIPIVPVIGGEGSKKPNTLYEKVFVFIMAVVLVILLVSPTAALLLKSLLSYSTKDLSGVLPSWRLSSENYSGLFINDRQSLFFVPPITAVKNSMLYAAGSMVISIMLGTFIVFGNSSAGRSNKWIDLIIMLPLGTSAVTLGLGYLTVFSTSPNSIRWFPVLIPIVHAIISLPFVIRIIQPAVQSIPENLHHAAVTLGVPKHKLWRIIDLPLIKGPLITAAIYAFAISLGEFGATSFLARPEYPTMPLAIYRYLNLPGAENYGKAMAMAAILLVICGIAFITIERLQIKNKGLNSK